MKNDNNKEISKIKLNEVVYDIKDLELRELIRRLAGDIKLEDNDAKESDIK